MKTTAELKNELKKYASPEKAQNSKRFFKTGPGEYGEGDCFLGVTVPELRQVAKQGFHLTLPQVEKLLHSKWHEERLLALLIMVQQYLKATPQIRDQIFELYQKNHQYINNWDLIDSSAPTIVGDYAQRHSLDLLYQWARSPILWERRSAIVGSLGLIRKQQFAPTLKLAQILLRDEQDLIHKATGWMLREVGKKDLRPLLKFLDQHAAKMPRTMLRYSLEKLTPTQRRHYLQAK